MKEALKQALINMENSAKFSFDNHEEDNTMLIYVHDCNKFCKYLEDEQLYPIGIGIKAPLTGYWEDSSYKALGFLFHDLKSDDEKWIHISELTYETMMLWFYDESVLEDKIYVINKEKE